MNKLKKLLKNKYRLLPLLFLFVIFVVSNITFLLTFAEDTSSFVEDPDYLESKVLDNKVYVNDLKNDYYYYMGLNYTTNDGHIPTKENKNIYNENNLVEVKTVYSSHDEKDLTGYVSINEKQDTYVYFNTFVVNDNNTPNDLTDDYIDYVLIDNPFTNRPTDQGFNGWTTQYRGAFVYYDDEYYERHVKIPISYSNNKPNKIDITFNASWVDATIYYSNGSFSDINSNIKQKNMEKIKIVTVKYDDYNMYGYYKSVLVGSWESLRGYYGITGNSYGGWNMCTNRSTEWNGSGCLVYEKITTNENFNENNDYYELRNGRMQSVTAEDLGITSTTIVSTKYNNSNMSGYYFKVSLNYGESTDNYYSNLGKRLSGTCNNYYGCEVYELIQYYDSEGVSNLFNSDNEYYYLVTRDTNIVVINDDISSSFSNNQNYPFTITGIHNGINYNSDWNVNSSINCYDDITIENVMLSYNGYISDRQEVNPSTNTNSSGVLFIRYNNVKVGRNITISNNGFSLRSIVGGSNSSTGSSGNPTKYKIIIESGKYASFSLSGGAQTGTGGNSLYLNNKATYGNDYDRVSNNLNNLIVTFCAAGSWGSRVYANTNSTTSKDVSFDLTVKSGSFGTGKIDLTTGIYVGGRYGGTQYAVRKVKVEGGYIYNLIGGPVSATNRSNYNDIYIYMTGGTVDMITGGAGKSATYGNRIIQVTGGLVNYSVFGGSNGNDGSGTDGTLNGSTYVYIGGNATIGSETLINNGSTLWGSEAGSVFGNGNGNTSSDSIGSCENSTIIIDEKALVNKNVYGGGNYGATGVSSTSNSSKTDIVIYNGTIKGSVFGGGNQNGAGDNYKTAHINIGMYNGVIATSLYGGSNIKGTIYGDVNILMAGGEISNSLYGGGKGGVSTNNAGTYVRDEVNVVIGNDTNKFIPIINGSVYGGSEAGSVNGSSITSTVSASTTNVTVNKGIINNVFGGGQGSESETPYVFGNIFVTVNDGTINNVFGGNDKSGKPNGDITVTINGGQINSTYGGGNETGANTTNVYLNGGVSTKIFGGSNLLGEVTTSNVITTGGESSLVYGGNNKGGTTNTTNITINDGNIATVYGGGNEASVENVNANVHSSTIGSTSNDAKMFGGGNKAKINDKINFTISDNTQVYGSVFGGGNLGEVEDTVTLTINDSIISNDIYGSGNLASVGKVEKDTISLNLNNTSAKTVYGGGNAALTNGNVNLIINNSNITDSIYGAGNGLDSIVPGDETGKDNPAKVNGNTNLTITNTTANNVYGGGNLGFVNNSTYVKLDSSTVTDSIYGGGNAAVVLNNTYLYVTNSKVLDSVYAGGNGVKAIVEGNTNLDIDNNSEITNHVFGGGNAAQTGTKEKNSSTGIVNIVGAIIGKNVYGGANTSVLYGETTVNIGSKVSLNKNLISSDIKISGTVFGGGEANAAGSEIYDFSFISVTKGIKINIDADSHQVFLINGSIFGSGNASSTSGYSYININNYGTIDSVKRNVSIQRASVVTLNNSYILLSGAKDRTNEYSDVLFTLSRIDELKLKNSSSLYLETGANLVKKFVSAVDVNGKEEKATVTIDNDNNIFTRNTNNRIYMLEGKNLNIAKNENVTEYGEVIGMTFFGMFSLDRNKNIITALYGDFDLNEVISSGDIYYFTNGSYVLGRHTTNHDITKDGFYSNYGSEEGNRVVIKYIEPTPQDTQFYMWTIGEVVASYDVTLTASKYSTLGAQEVPLINHTDNNTTFSILGVNFSNLDENVKLVDYKDIPRVAKTSEEADTVFGLNMKNGTVGWTNDGSTNFITEGNTNIVGTKDYIRENINNVPALVFYFYHSKNLSTSGQLGSVTISLVAITRIDDLNNKVERINININLTKALFNSNDYEGTITPGKQYEMFATSETNISNRSSFSTYYSLFMESESTPYKSGYHRSLVSTYVLPVNTKITMIDLHDVSNPEYYYYTINENDYNASIEEYNMYGEVSYKISNFIKMGSTSSNNTYKDSDHNMKYYNESTNTAEEEFIFMVDFKDAVINEDVLNKSLLIELRNSDEQTLIGVLGIEQQTLKYNIYTESDAYIGLVGDISKDTVYLGNQTNLIIDSSYMEKEKNGVKVKDTTFGEDKVGLMISIIDKNGNILSGQDLFGVSFKYMGLSYYPSSDGITRIKISDKVSNIRSIITLDTGTSSLSTGEYTILINSFGSVDGIYYGVSTLMETSLKVKIIDTPYGLKTNSQNNYIFVDKDTGITLVGNDSYLLNVSYKSNLDNPNLRIKLQRRDYKDIYSLKYTDVDLMDYVSNDYRKSSVNNLYYLSTNPVSDVQYNLHMKSNLVTGTYRLVVSLYDNDNYIGEVYEYMIIK